MTDKAAVKKALKTVKRKRKKPMKHKIGFNSQ
jgi:hypothetical protein